MDSRILSAVDRKKTCNCAQAVIATYADIAGISQEQAMNLGNAFGSGMGNMDGTCGALTGAAIIVGLVTGDKLRSRHVMSNIMAQFKQRNGATQCRALKGIDTHQTLRECHDCVADACEFLEKELF